MDREVYLILIGAGISLATSVVTLILQLLLGEITHRIRNKERQKEELRRILLDKDKWPKYKSTFDDLICSGAKGIDEKYLESLVDGINSFVYRTSPLGLNTAVNFIVTTVSIFLVWIFIVIPRIH